MLKIIDNVDLKTLGFDKDDEDFLWQDDVGLIIEDGELYFGGISDFIMSQEKHLDRLFDLIQAGLVEKFSRKSR